MKKKSIPKNHEATSDDLLPEYDFDYRKARPNRFADQVNSDQLTVILDSDVAEVFTSAESVNKVLRALITAMPKVGE